MGMGAVVLFLPSNHLLTREIKEVQVLSHSIMVGLTKTMAEVMEGKVDHIPHNLNKEEDLSISKDRSLVHLTMVEAEVDLSQDLNDLRAVSVAHHIHLNRNQDLPLMEEDLDPNSLMEMEEGVVLGLLTLPNLDLHQIVDPDPSNHSEAEVDLILPNQDLPQMADPDLSNHLEAEVGLILPNQDLHQMVDPDPSNHLEAEVDLILPNQGLPQMVDLDLNNHLGAEVDLMLPNQDLHPMVGLDLNKLLGEEHQDQLGEVDHLLRNPAHNNLIIKEGVVGMVEEDLGAVEGHNHKDHPIMGEVIGPVMEEVELYFPTHFQ